MKIKNFFSLYIVLNIFAFKIAFGMEDLYNTTYLENKFKEVYKENINLIDLKENIKVTELTTFLINNYFKTLNEKISEDYIELIENSIEIKNFIPNNIYNKGSFAIISYIINEYLKNKNNKDENDLKLEKKYKIFELNTKQLLEDRKFNRFLNESNVFNIYQNINFYKLIKNDQNGENIFLKIFESLNNKKKEEKFEQNNQNQNNKDQIDFQVDEKTWNTFYKNIYLENTEFNKKNNQTNIDELRYKQNMNNYLDTLNNEILSQKTFVNRNQKANKYIYKIEELINFMIEIKVVKYNKEDKKYEMTDELKSIKTKELDIEIFRKMLQNSLDQYNYYLSVDKTNPIYKNFGIYTLFSKNYKNNFIQLLLTNNREDNNNFINILKKISNIINLKLKKSKDSFFESLSKFLFDSKNKQIKIQSKKEDLDFKEFSEIRNKKRAEYAKMMKQQEENENNQSNNNKNKKDKFLELDPKIQNNNNKYNINENPNSNRLIINNNKDEIPKKFNTEIQNNNNYDINYDLYKTVRDDEDPRSKLDPEIKNNNKESSLRHSIFYNPKFIEAIRNVNNNNKENNSDKKNVFTELLKYRMYPSMANFSSKFNDNDTLKKVASSN